MFGPGSVIGGRYELRSLVGSGGMSTVYVAHDRRLNRDVAVKLLNPALAADAAFVERFKREAQNAAGLSHPNIVAVYDWGNDGGTYFIVMEYVAGSTLKEVIERRGARPEPEALTIAMEVTAALEAAHAHGVVHRDVKPDNVLLDTEGAVKVTDFGIARATGETQLTDTGTVLGSAHYASPEQIERRPVDARSDVYSLGAVLYELLTGRPPFTGDGPLAVAWQHVHERPAAPSTLAPGISAATEGLVLKALEKDPTDRFQSAAELGGALRGALNGRDPASTAPLPVVAPAEAADAVTAAMPVALRPTAPAPPPAPPTIAPQDTHTAPLPVGRRQRPRANGRPLVLAALALLLLLPATLWAMRPRAGAPVAAPAADTVQVPTPAQDGAGVAGVAATAEVSPTLPEPTATVARPTTAPPTLVPTAAPTAAPTRAPASPTAAPVVATSQEPAAAVSGFYSAVAQKNFARAAALWSPRMQAQYPPAQFIDQRFAQTQSLRVNGMRVVEVTGDRAVVAVDLTEVIGNPAETRRWVGTWSLVRSAGWWLLDAPNLGPG